MNVIIRRGPSRYWRIYAVQFLERAPVARRARALKRAASGPPGVDGSAATMSMRRPRVVRWIAAAAVAVAGDAIRIDVTGAPAMA